MVQELLKCWKWRPDCSSVLFSLMTEYEVNNHVNYIKLFNCLHLINQNCQDKLDKIIQISFLKSNSNLTSRLYLASSLGLLLLEDSQNAMTDLTGCSS